MSWPSSLSQIIDALFSAMVKIGGVMTKPQNLIFMTPIALLLLRRVVNILKIFKG